MDRTSSFLLILEIVVLLHCLMATSDKTLRRNLTTDQEALLALKSHFTLDPHHILEKSWSVSSSGSVCDWFGVTCCSLHHRVTALNISRLGITGTLPPEIGNVSFLSILDVSRNKFHGNLPVELAKLHRLEVIALGFNFFTGQIPTWLGSLSNLTIISLTSNSFTGSIPPSISNLSKLELLKLQNNSLQGEIPEGIGNLHNLKVLDLSGNHLISPIPSGVFSISSLVVISLGRNNLFGELPVDVCYSLPYINVLDLSDNALSGQIPASLSNCSKLRVLSLSRNNFSGVLPENIGELIMLEELYVGENNFTQGVVPKEFANLRRLKRLGMEHSQRIGTIPPFLCSISTLERINLCFNHLTGAIPGEMSNHERLEEIQLCYNSLNGYIPKGIFNISNLKLLHLASNQLSGSLPPDMGYGLPNLERLILSTNNLRGIIPKSISNSTKLRELWLNRNEFYGAIPGSLGDIRFLERLVLYQNNLTGDSIDQELSFITSLTKCRYLRVLEVSMNPLDGRFPVSIGNLSSFEKFTANDCRIKGTIRSEIGNLSRLVILSMNNNFLNGPIPAFAKSIQQVSLRNNKLDGSSLEIFCELPNLSLLRLSRNKISGQIPGCLGNVTSLRYLFFDHNRLTSPIPSSIWKLKYLLNLDGSANSFSGSLPPEIGKLKTALAISFSSNRFSGAIPGSLGGLSDLQSLRLNHNRLRGSIPKSLGMMLSLEDLDLSQNGLSGLIPKSLEAIVYLKHFNVSFNDLSGEIPSNGAFRNFTSLSFMGNEQLCGDPRFKVRPCPVLTHKGRLGKKLLVVLSLVGLAVLICAKACVFVKRRCKTRHQVSGGTKLFHLPKPQRISYYELLEATERYSESNLLGSGSFGSVYKASLRDGSLVAVKVFNLQIESAYQSFETECEVLCNLRHRNLTKVISSCCNEDFKALVLEYMPNGSLEKWLYSYNYFLDLMQRLDIMIDIASALEYLHHGYPTPLVHRDLKPSNVLLDEHMVAHVSDFGIAKSLCEGKSICHTNTLSTIGYIAPEYGLEGLVSTRCDVYSFGILMMEAFTRTKPSDEMFDADLSLKHWISNSIPDAILQVVDSNLVRPNEPYFMEKLKCLKSIMELALTCSAENPNARVDMTDCQATLKKIKLEFAAHCGGASHFSFE